MKEWTRGTSSTLPILLTTASPPLMTTLILPPFIAPTIIPDYSVPGPRPTTTYLRPLYLPLFPTNSEHLDPRIVSPCTHCLI